MKSIIGQMCQLFFRTFPQYNNKHSFWLSFERKYYGRFCFLFDKKHVQTFRSNRDGACIHQSMSMVDEKKDDFPNIAWMYAWVSRKFIHTYLCRNVSINFFFSLPFSVWILLCRKKSLKKRISIQLNAISNPIQSNRFEYIGTQHTNYTAKLIVIHMTLTTTNAIIVDQNSRVPHIFLRFVGKSHTFS